MNRSDMSTADMNPKDARALHVELHALDAGADGAAHWVHDLDLRRQEYKIRIGTRDDADIALPAARFPQMGRLHCAIVALPERTALEIHHPLPAATLDGAPAHDATLKPGAHELVIGEYRFRLTVQCAPAGAAA